jgi:hypothetical protein
MMAVEIKVALIGIVGVIFGIFSTMYGNWLSMQFRYHVFKKESKYRLIDIYYKDQYNAFMTIMEAGANILYQLHNFHSFDKESAIKKIEEYADIVYFTNMKNQIFTMGLNDYIKTITDETKDIKLRSSDFDAIKTHDVIKEAMDKINIVVHKTTGVIILNDFIKNELKTYKLRHSNDLNILDKIKKCWHDIFNG